MDGCFGKAGNPTVAASQTFTAPSLPPVTIYFPSGDQSTEVTSEPWPFMVPSSCIVTTSHSLAVRSREPVTNLFLSGENENVTTSLVWPDRLVVTRRVLRSQEYRRPSPDVAMSLEPPGSKTAWIRTPS